MEQDYVSEIKELYANKGIEAVGDYIRETFKTDEGEVAVLPDEVKEVLASLEVPAKEEVAVEE